MDKFIPNADFDNILDTIKNKTSEGLAELNKYPIENETLSLTELKQLKETDDYLNGLASDYKRNAKLVSDAHQRGLLCQQYIIAIEQALDKKDGVWQYKFTTDRESAGSVDEPIGESGLDSLYYMTKSGVGLRLKRSNFNKGLTHVIQPIMEKIIFEKIEGDNTEFKERPEVGYVVDEFSSEEFYKAIADSSKEYKSVINLHKEGKVFKGLTVTGAVKHQHLGDRVNKIIFNQ